MFLNMVVHYFEKSDKLDAKAIVLIQSFSFNIATFVLPFVMTFSQVQRILQRFGFMAVLSSLLYLFLTVDLVIKQMMLPCFFAPISTYEPVYVM